MGRMRLRLRPRLLGTLLACAATGCGPSGGSDDAGIDADDILAKPREAVTYNGKIYAIPIDVHGALWHINLDLWDKAGLVGADGKPMLPTSLSEFEAACQKIKAAGGGPILGSGDDDVMRLTTPGGMPVFCGEPPNPATMRGTPPGSWSVLLPP